MRCGVYFPMFGHVECAVWRQVNGVGAPCLHAPPASRNLPRRVPGSERMHLCYAFAAAAFVGSGALATYGPMGSTSLPKAVLMIMAANRYHAVAAQSKPS